VAACYTVPSIGANSGSTSSLGSSRASETVADYAAAAKIALNAAEIVASTLQHEGTIKLIDTIAQACSSAPGGLKTPSTTMDRLLRSRGKKAKRSKPAHATPTSVEDTFEVEEILSHKTDKKGKVSYHIKWMGYDEFSWLSEQEMTGCSDLVKNYHSTLND
jgi:hypothetical protein